MRDAQPLPLHLLGRTPVFAAPNSAGVAVGDDTGSGGGAVAAACSSGALIRYVDARRARAAALSEALVAAATLEDAADATTALVRFAGADAGGVSSRAAAYAEWEALASVPEHDAGLSGTLNAQQQAISQALLTQVGLRAARVGCAPCRPSPPSPPLMQLSAGGGLLLVPSAAAQAAAGYGGAHVPPPPPQRVGYAGMVRAPLTPGAGLALAPASLGVPSAPRPVYEGPDTPAAAVASVAPSHGATRSATAPPPPTAPVAPPPLPDPDTFDMTAVLAPLPEAALAVVSRLLAVVRQSDAAEKAARVAASRTEGAAVATQMSHVIYMLQVSCQKGRRRRGTPPAEEP